MKPNQITLYLLTIALAFFNFNSQWGYQSGSAWWTHLTFHFAHANIFHLAANLLVVFLLLPQNQKSRHWLLFPISYLIATACSFIISTHKPTLGLSGILFAYYGIIFLKDGPQWKPLIHTIIYMVVSCFFASRMAIGLHCICLFIGALIGGFMDMANKIDEKVNLYNNHYQNNEIKS